ncbi:hypothetical protein AB0F46_01650 [Streptomyces sp. NPDC026665]|uniref:hypothetical protein n=1 Tax=Streptomyces sp. NPDC026665 TaxID=3154798 RepID=UPI00340B0F70
MATIGKADLPIPGGGDSPTTPGHLAELASVIDLHLLQHVEDVSERDAEFSTAPLHTAVTAEDGTLWLKTSASTNTWATIWEPDPGWRPFSLSSGFEADQTDPEIKRIGNQVWLRGRIKRTDGTPIVSNATKLGEVPDDCIPPQLASYAGGSSITGDPVVGVARFEVYSPLNTLQDPGSLMLYSQDGDPYGFTWVDISGSYWKD